MLPAWAKGALVLALTLAAGIAMGIGYERRRAPTHSAVSTESHHVMHRMAHNLELDSVQHARIAAIFARRQTAVDSTWHSMRPHVRATLDSTHDEIMAVLRPDQAAKFREMVEVMHPRPPR